MKTGMVKFVFYISALYDGILGLLFLLIPMRIFDWYQTEPPNHAGYVQFSALILIVFGIMFFKIAQNPLKNMILIPYGILLKVSYCLVVFYYWLSTGIPAMWKPYAIADLVFLVLYLYIYRVLRKKI